MSFKLTILGCSSAVSNINTFPTAQLLNVNERFFLIDCGEGTQFQLKKYNINANRISHIFISHLHGDHYFGLIGLIISMHLQGRKKELHVYAHEKLREIINVHLQASSTELNYPFFFHPISTKHEDLLFEDNVIKINHVLLRHTVPCSGFIFTEKKSKRKIKNNLVTKYNIPLKKLEGIKNGLDWINSKGDVIKNKDLTTKNIPPYTYAFCTDTSYFNELPKKIQNISLLYYDTTFKNDMFQRAIETGHSTTYDAANIAIESRARHLLLGHFSQRYKELDLLLQEVKSKFSNTILSEAGMTIDFKKLK